MSVDQTPVAVPERTTVRPDGRLVGHPGLHEGLLEGVLDGERWWHETWASPAPSAPRAAPRSSWRQRVRAVVWPAACSRAL